MLSFFSRLSLIPFAFIVSLDFTACRYVALFFRSSEIQLLEPYHVIIMIVIITVKEQKKLYENIMPKPVLAAIHKA